MTQPQPYTPAELALVLAEWERLVYGAVNCPGLNGLSWKEADLRNWLYGQQSRLRTTLAAMAAVISTKVANMLCFSCRKMWSMEADKEPCPQAHREHWPHEWVSRRVLHATAKCVEHLNKCEAQAAEIQRLRALLGEVSELFEILERRCPICGGAYRGHLTTCVLGAVAAKLQAEGVPQ